MTTSNLSDGFGVPEPVDLNRIGSSDADISSIGTNKIKLKKNQVKIVRAETTIQDHQRDSPDFVC